MRTTPRAPSSSRSGAGTTAPVKATAESANRSLSWAVHWVYPHAAILPLVEGSATVGRDNASDWVLRDEQVSRQHATFVVSGGTCRILDQGSSNGVAVNGERIRDAALHDGAVIRCGNSVGAVVYAPFATTPESTLALFDGHSAIGSGKLKSVFDRAKALAPLEEAVLVYGESGSGKELVAEVLHRESARPGRYVPLNCARFQANLAGSELFGHVRGAFSGAAREHTGAALAAHGGTLFLDEVGELAQDVQAQLLRFLESGEVLPVGGERPKRATSRVISATHRNLRALCRTSAFREDLYYRMSVHTLEVPPLRERRADILGLFEHFAGRPRSGMSPGFVVELLLADWPGNVRELKNVAARLRANHAEEPLWSHHLLADERQMNEPRAPETAAPALDARKLSREDWVELYRAHAGNAAQIARAKNLSPTTVKRYLAQYRVKG